MQSASLKGVELACRHLELEAKESGERAARAEAERDTTHHEATMAKLEIEGAVNARARVKSELALARVQRALAIAESVRLKAEFESEVAQKALSLEGGGLYEGRGRKQWFDGRATFLDFGPWDHK